MQMTIVLMLLYAGIQAARTNAQCGGGLTLIGRTCFFVDKKIKKSRAAAEVFCGKKGAQLAHPRTRQENSEIEKYLNTFDSGFWFFANMFWFGLKRASSGEFEFTQGKPGYSHWQKGEPSGRGENCCEYVCKDHHCQWNDAMCSQEKMFVCQLRVCPRACLHKSDTNSTQTTTTTTKLPFTVSRVTKDETQGFSTLTPPSGYSWSTLTPEATTVITGQQADQTEAEAKVNNRVKATEVQKQYNGSKSGCGRVFLGLLLVPLVTCVMQIL
ncbi:uncharacterized protein [Haliotis cracherodii]|uniref:uncharacterized protein n=1 Tax=Haliotis cracherodii TaxID=6455 RepID=UPI0039EAA266